MWVGWGGLCVWVARRDSSELQNGSVNTDGSMTERGAPRGQDPAIKARIKCGAVTGFHKSWALDIPRSSPEHKCKNGGC